MVNTEAHGDSQTIRKSTGEAVKIQKIQSINDGEMTFRTGTEEMVAADDVTFGSVAYSLGQLFAGKQIAKEVAAISNNKKSGIMQSGKVYFDGDRSKLNATQKAGIEQYSERGADTKEQDKSLWEKICDWFKDFTGKLKQIVDSYKGIKPDSVEGSIPATLKNGGFSWRNTTASMVPVRL